MAYNDTLYESLTMFNIKKIVARKNITAYIISLNADLALLDHNADPVEAPYTHVRIKQLMTQLAKANAELLAL